MGLLTSGPLFIFIILGIATLASGQSSNGSTCAVALKPLASDPAAQSGVASILLTSTIDTSDEFLCSSGSNYDATGIACYALKCPAPVSYGPYGAPPGQPGPGYGPQPGRYGGVSGPISIGPQVAYVETAHGCWKLKQIRLNSYVYLVCFTKGHPSTLFQVVFKDNSGLELANYDAIPYKHLTAVGRGSFSAENQYLCVAAVYSSYGPSYSRGDHVHTHPTDQLAPIYVICPNNYKWYFCGNVNIKDTVDVSVWYAQSTLHAIFVQLRKESTCNATNATLSHCSRTPIVQYTIVPDIDHYVCPSRLEKEVLTIGPPPTEEDPNNSYILRGIQTCTIVANNNATLLCCAVDSELGCPSDPATAQVYSSFCIPYDTNANRFLTERVVFLIGSEHASDIQLIRGAGDCCQFILTNGPAQSLQAYSLQTIITNLNNLSNPDPVSISPANLGEEHLFDNAVFCSNKPKCCGTSNTCLTCVRPAKYAEKYLAEFSCPSGTPPVMASLYGYEDGSYGGGSYAGQPQQRLPYGAPPLLQAGPYGRPANYSSPLMAYGPPLQQYGGYGPHPGPAPYAPPPYNAGPQQNPVYHPPAIRYN